MDINAIIELIANQGISVFLVIYYVVKQNKATENNTEVLVKLTTLIEEMNKKNKEEIK